MPEIENEYEPEPYQMRGGLCDVCGGAGKIVTYQIVARPPFDYCECPHEIIECPSCKDTGYN